MRSFHLCGVAVLGILFAGMTVARADFVISSAILEFTAGGPTQQDIEVASRSQDKDYLVTEISEILHPGAANETRQLIDDPEQAGLLVTPDKTVLAGGGRRVLRFVLLRKPDGQEHIYRVAIKPVIKGVENAPKVGLKVLIGYEVLVIVRPDMVQTTYSGKRTGKTLTVTNTGNTNILFENGTQCKDDEKCAPPPVLRVYPGQTASVELPQEKAVDYVVWNGTKTSDHHFD